MRPNQPTHAPALPGLPLPAGIGGGGGQLQPSQSSERLIDNSAPHPPPPQPHSGDFAYYSEMLPPELARQLMLGECKDGCLFPHTH